jgi:hypothetical protein
VPRRRVGGPGGGRPGGTCQWPLLLLGPTTILGHRQAYVCHQAVPVMWPPLPGDGNPVARESISSRLKLAISLARNRDAPAPSRWRSPPPSGAPAVTAG